MGSLVLDANVPIALLDSADVHHARAATQLDAAVESGDDLLLAASAYSEIMVHALRKQRGDLIEAFVARMRIEVVPVDRAIARGAAELRAAHQALRLPDALVLATARHRGARLITFDERLAQL